MAQRGAQLQTPVGGACSLSAHVTNGRQHQTTLHNDALNRACCTGQTPGGLTLEVGSILAGRTKTGIQQSLAAEIKGPDVHGTC